jgi:hypothetical protein
MPESGPLWAHDCTRCTFLGHFEEHDLYVCVGRQDVGPTVIARYGPNEDCYEGLHLSKAPLKRLDVNVGGPVDGIRGAKYLLRVAHLLAADMGLLPWCTNDLYEPAIKKIVEMSAELQLLAMDNVNDSADREIELVNNIAVLAEEVHVNHRLPPHIMGGEEAPS